MSQYADQYNQSLSIIKQHIDAMAKQNNDAALSFMDEVRRYLNKREVEVREKSGKYSNYEF